MIKCAIYPRKSKASDDSDSMKLQIEACEKYINDKYGKSNCKIIIYDKDYGITGHSIKKRKDFQRMMLDIEEQRINLVCIIRYDRIARNMRDFCNTYHSMEENGCELVSVSQQIDTSTPYGKNFMYQMAAMAELEWALTSERYKDMHKYKIAHGLAYTGKIPRFGFEIKKTEMGKILVHDREEETRAIFDYLLKTKSKNDTVRFVRENYDTEFTRRMLESMVASDLYIGKVRDNENFCEPYFEKDYMSKIRSLNCIKAAPTGNVYLFSGMIRCPLCGRKLSANPNKKHGNLYVYYRCPNSIQSKHEHFAISEQSIEDAVVNDLKAYLDDFIARITNISPKTKKAKIRHINDVEQSMKRLDHLFEMGRISVEEYDKKISAYKEELEEAKTQVDEKPIIADSMIVDDWQVIYKKLTRQKQRIWLNRIIKEIVVDSDKNVTSIKFN